MLPRRFSLLILAACFLLACSPRSYVVSRMADAASSGGDVFARDDDPELVRDAVPFALKAMESLLASSPDHKGLLTALCKGFTQYAVAFVREDAEEAEDPAVRRAGVERARRLFLRAKEYGVRGLSVGREGFTAALSGDPVGASARVGAEDVPLLYWTGAAWSLAVSTSSDDPSLLADLPRIEALMRRALALDERYDAGAIHEFFVAFEGGVPRRWEDRSSGRGIIWIGRWSCPRERRSPRWSPSPRRWRSGPRTGRSSWTSSTGRSPSTRGRRRRSTGWGTSCPSAARAG